MRATCRGEPAVRSTCLPRRGHTALTALMDAWMPACGHAPARATPADVPAGARHGTGHTREGGARQLWGGSRRGVRPASVVSGVHGGRLTLQVVRDVGYMYLRQRLCDVAAGVACPSDDTGRLPPSPWVHFPALPCTSPGERIPWVAHTPARPSNTQMPRRRQTPHTRAHCWLGRGGRCVHRRADSGRPPAPWVRGVVLGRMGIAGTAATARC
jgi:hypothetical protein